jgi:hypothetical protein
MFGPLYEQRLLKYRFKESFATVKVIPLDSGTCSEWWVSHNSEGNLRVVGNFMIPILSYTVAEAEQRCGHIAEGVIEFAIWSGNGLAGVPGASDDGRRAHCLAHLQENFDALERSGGSTAVEKTCALYLLALGFNVNNPAALIAQAEGLSSVKTVHERLNYGRRTGLLSSPGKGRRR